MLKATIEGPEKPDVVTVIELTDESFDKEVVKASVPVLVDFWAPWCGPCKAIAPIVHKIAEKYKDKIKVGKVNIDSHQKVAQSFGVQSIPTLFVFKKGKVSGVIVGSASQAKIESIIEKALTS